MMKRLFKSWPSRIAACIIGLTFVVAIFAYAFAPENSPDANRMIVELSARPAGFQKEFLLIPKHNFNHQTQPLEGIFTGKPQSDFYLPINDYYLKNDSIIVRHYIDVDLEDTLSFSIASLNPEKEILNDTPEELKSWIQKNRIINKHFLLGTDRYGRDILSRLIIGSRVSIAVGLISVILSINIGIILGSVAGWFGGIIDGTVMWFINILWSIPTLLLVFAITLTIGKGFWEIFIAIGLTSWVTAARLIRGQVMQIKEMDFIMAARALGYKDSRIIFRHILPNIAGPIMVIASANFATAILVEAGLSFLGIGVQPPTPSWGLMIKEHYTFLVAGNPFPALIPGLAIMILVLAFNILGNSLRDAIDIRS